MRATADGSFRPEQLQTDLEPADVAGQPLGQRRGLVEGGDVQRDDQPVAGFGHGHLQ
jgi:hypothetical protein